jgi:hypothetical protein
VGLVLTTVLCFSVLQLVAEPPKNQIALSGNLTIGNVTKARGSAAGPIIEHQTVLDVPLNFKLNKLVGGSKAGPIAIFFCVADATGDCGPDLFQRTRFGGPTFSNVTSDSTVSTRMQIVAPTAGAKSKLRVNVCKGGVAGSCGELLAVQESAEMQVAASYRVSISQVTNWHIASPHADTIWLALNSALEGSDTSCSPGHCAFNVPDPTHYPNEYYKPTDTLNGDTHPAFIWTGTFTLVPDVDPDIIVSYAVLNFGEDYSQDDWGALKSKVQARLSASIATFPGDDKINPIKNLSNDANPPKWKGCDGPLTAAVNRFSNHGGANSLDVVTRSSALELQPRKPDTQTFEGCESSIYSAKVVAGRVTRP